MAAYVIANVEVLNPKDYEAYRAMVPPTIAAFGGRFIARGGKVDVLEGSWKPNRLVILEFPDAATARRWYDSPEYAEAKKVRQAHSRGDLVLVEGL
jgi:uncharacterized protein (DUF1330 family)